MIIPKPDGHELVMNGSFRRPNTKIAKVKNEPTKGGYGNLQNGSRQDEASSGMKINKITGMPTETLFIYFINMVY